MKYDPKKHHRKTMRLKGYDYSKEGAYFITICCQDHNCRFGKVKTNRETGKAYMELNEFGKIAYDEWINLQERFGTFELDVFQIMPNHMHGIIILNESSEKARIDKNESDQNDNVEVSKSDSTTNPTISDIVGAYKSIVANNCLEIYKSRNQRMGKLWQRSFWDDIIRDEDSYIRISKYIIDNPEKWAQDKFYKK